MDLPKFIGLDIGSSSIRLARVEYKLGGKPEVVSVGQLLLDTPVVSLSDPGTRKYVTQKIKELVVAERLDTNKVVAALPESMIFSKVATVPNIVEEQLEQMLFYELKNHIPVNPTEVQKDYIVLGLDQNNPKLLKILLIAAPKALVELYKSVIIDAGLELIALETETVALARVTSVSINPQEVSLIADFGHKGVDLCLVKGGKILYSQSIGTGSEALTKAIAMEFNITFQQAEQYKTKIGLDDKQLEGKVKRALVPIMHVITNEITKLINYFKNSMPENTPKAIYFVGEGSKLPGLNEYLAQELSVPCVQYDPVSKVAMSGDIKKEIGQYGATGFSVAVGLAMKTE